LHRVDFLRGKIDAGVGHVFDPDGNRACRVMPGLVPGIHAFCIVLSR
jgi:hypothetical protein